VTTVHLPVLPGPVLEWMQPVAQTVLVDGTVGGAGHARLMCELIGQNGQVIGLDRDASALARIETMAPPANLKLIQASYCRLPDVLESMGLTQVDGILLDLGLSSDQLADESRGFSFRIDAPLDLRFDTSSGSPASDLLRHIREEDLANIIYQFGEERCSRRIAKLIVESRRERPITSTKQLHDLIHRAMPGYSGRIDSATRTFQALRIAVNQELEHLEKALQVLPDCLRPGGRLLIISFHSLEDRLVKNAFRDDPRLNRLTKKPVVADFAETNSNPRSRSAKMRVAERVS
jgi:16S rRNA (cytosine1402-N4)-methyltransferase